MLALSRLPHAAMSKPKYRECMAHKIRARAVEENLFSTFGRRRRKADRQFKFSINFFKNAAGKLGKEKGAS
jgi:hypothetical protein